LIRHCHDERRSCFRSAPSLSIVAVSTPQFMPGILRWGEFHEQFTKAWTQGIVPAIRSNLDLITASGHVYALPQVDGCSSVSVS
jgi:hypothetical protein